MNTQELAEARERSRKAILDAALSEARDVGYAAMTRRSVAARAKVATGLVNHYYGTMDGLREAVMAEAVKRRDLSLVRQGLANAHPAAIAAPVDLRQAAMISA